MILQRKIEILLLVEESQMVERILGWKTAAVKEALPYPFHWLKPCEPLKGLSQESPFKVIPDSLTMYDFSLFCVPLASYASLCYLFLGTLYNHYKFIS